MTQFLWHRTKKNGLYIDLTTVSGQALVSFDADGTVDYLFQEAKSPQYQRNNSLAELVREQGKLLFAQANYVEAIHKFNLSLKSAANDSDEIALAYANRSACFLHLDLIEECLVDICLAKKANYPTHLMHKLEKRSVKCTNMLIDEEFKENRFIPRKFSLSYEEHSEFVGAAACLEIWKSLEFGHHVVTTSDLKVGDTILVETPYSIIRKRMYKSSRDRCMHCFRVGMNFISCCDCVGSIFCNSSCMEKSFHKYECNMPFALSRKETFELVLKMVFNINAAFSDVDLLMNTVEALLKGKEPERLTSAAQKNFCSIFRLNHNHPKQYGPVLERFRAATSVAVITLMRFPDFKRKYVTLKHRRFLNHLIVHLFHIAEHSVDLHEYTQVSNHDPVIKCTYQNYASGMYAFGCYINHSCLPNVAWLSADGRLVCKVIRPIEKNEQIFRSYL